MHHRYGPFHNLLAGTDNGRCLLAAQHHGGNLGCVSQVVDAGFHHLQPSHDKPLVQFLLQLFVDFLATRTESQFAGLALIVVVGILPGHLAQGRIALYPHEILEGIHTPGNRVAHADGHFLAVGGRSRGRSHGLRVYLEHRFIRVLQLPYQYQADEDRVAYFVVHLDRLNVEVAGAQRKFLLVKERIDPIETRLPKRALIVAEEHHGACLVRLQLHIACQQDKPRQRQYAARHVEGHTTHGKADHNNGCKHQQMKEKHGKTIHLESLEHKFFCFHSK